MLQDLVSYASKIKGHLSDRNLSDRFWHIPMQQLLQERVDYAPRMKSHISDRSCFRNSGRIGLHPVDTFSGEVGALAEQTDSAYQE